MKRLKIFPKTFLYTLALMLLITLIAHVLLYVLAPKMTFAGTQKTAYNDVQLSVVFDQTQLVTQTIARALPISLICCVVVSVICSLFFSKAFTIPVRRISAATERMALLDKTVRCEAHSTDEIGILAGNINELYRSLLSTIENLQAEKKKVSESEKSKVDFLRAASHELNTCNCAQRYIGKYDPWRWQV